MPVLNGDKIIRALDRLEWTQNEFVKRLYRFSKSGPNTTQSENNNKAPEGNHAFEDDKKSPEGNATTGENNDPPGKKTWMLIAKGEKEATEEQCRTIFEVIAQGISERTDRKSFDELMWYGPELLYQERLSFEDRVKHLEVLVKQESRVLIWGMAGVGKSYLLDRLRLRPEIENTFSRCAFVHLGQNPVVLRLLGEIADQLQLDISLDDNPQKIKNAIAKKILAETGKVLLLIDDVWDTADYWELLGGLIGHGSKTNELVHIVSSSRLNSPELVDGRANCIFRIDCLLRKECVELLLKRIGNDAVALFGKEWHEKLDELANAIEDLPLTAIVAAGMISTFKSQMEAFDSIVNRTEECKLLPEIIPTDRAGEARTVQAVLDLSYEYLEPNEQACYRLLGSFSPDRYSFNGDAFKDWWRPITDIEAEAILNKLYRHGILEAYSRKRDSLYRIHTLILEHARSKSKKAVIHFDDD